MVEIRLKMWYDSHVDANRLQYALRSSEAAVTYAQDVRAAHRKRSKKGSAARETDIRIALERLRRVMEPIRSELAKLPRKIEKAAGEPLADILTDQGVQLKAASCAIQRERRKLWKMQKRRRKHGTGRRRR